jgi:hypothetical protein
MGKNKFEAWEAYTGVKVRDDLRAKGTVEVVCEKCEWSFWLHCTDPAIPDGPFVCPTCRELRGEPPLEKAED